MQVLRILSGTMYLYVLSVPVVNLMDVAKHNFVFSFHVIRNTIFFHKCHVALQLNSYDKCISWNMSESISGLLINSHRRQNRRMHCLVTSSLSKTNKKPHMKSIFNWYLEYTHYIHCCNFLSLDCSALTDQNSSKELKTFT